MKINPAFVAAMHQPGSSIKATLASYSADDRPRPVVLHGSYTGKMNSDGTLVGQFISHDAHVETLDEKCIAAIEQVLASGTDLPYVARSSLGLSGPGPTMSDQTKTSEQYIALKEKGISAMIAVHLSFRIGVGWKKPLILAIRWRIYSPDGQTLVEADTEIESAATDSVFPDIADPQNEATLIDLAKRNAMWFLTMFAGA
jgi:hypothetical protein